MMRNFPEIGALFAFGIAAHKLQGWEDGELERRPHVFTQWVFGEHLWESAGGRADAS